MKQKRQSPKVVVEPKGDRNVKWHRCEKCQSSADASLGNAKRRNARQTARKIPKDTPTTLLGGEVEKTVKMLETAQKAVGSKVSLIVYS